MSKEKDMKVFTEILHGRMMTSLYKELNLKGIHTDYIGTVESDFGAAVISLPGYINLNIDRNINGGKVVFVKSLLESPIDLDNYANSLIGGVASQINNELIEERPTRFVVQIIMTIGGEKIDFSIIYGFAWEPKSYADRIVDKVVKDAESFLNELKENAPSTQTASELASAAMASIKKPIDNRLKDKVENKIEEGLRFLGDTNSSDFDRWHLTLNCIGAAYNMALDGRNACQVNLRKKFKLAFLCSKW